jgi:hypothetical protein
MNLRIRELADEAFVTVSSDGYFSSGKFCEKFAELIVRECAEVAQMNTPDTEECEYTHLISEKIKEHFGVEE